MNFEEMKAAAKEFAERELSETQKLHLSAISAKDAEDLYPRVAGRFEGYLFGLQTAHSGEGNADGRQ